MNVREKIESSERLTLIKEAAFSSQTNGREIDEEVDNFRTCYMIDRDRIIHSKSFRRLKHKTQVYIKTFGDHYRTRLTHTLEVSQVARTIAVGIGLNETLVEAISLGHDLGHVAFAHNGEEVLNEFLPQGFRHNEQSVRVVTKLEKEGNGLNLTEEVIDGILNHSGLSSNNKGARTLEGRIVQYSDKIAYINHDIDDSVRAGLLSEEILPRELCNVLGHSHSDRINTLVSDLIKTSKKNLDNGIREVGLSSEIGEAMRELRTFMFKNVYLSDELKEERKKAKFVLEQLIKYFMKYPEQMPKLYFDIANVESRERGVSDYIAGMSDDYCLNLFNKVYVPKLVIY
ncbi:MULTISPECIES: deoxyguanosinetriphosphate triphosphohydrolase [Clostridium]|uniref:Deoxyguanosinetriphosphate triphosphohydrolase n=1 Tax=Clostridium cibarium TaxID=2762247 RepID=A0ABR8PNN3_9CLOT|nr:MULTISPECIES: deoxyguanosinetriphosphate triphosphohydrolase [Clostridium]MBD7909773.1 deoxyguanosinetriphosphate triphosphohydrolase [Clostridium cibarium]